ncbi:MAG: bifunctional phosphoribosylaminoimidazolecarboxamide formyltransferase/IMP cyclohydrolase PurH [Proteobacteria bacterium]|nr:bifunctional phosphoribosylaminoimidazolecarboxamide formyltransferase/IMP cyclohydrolase PurH [Pseudomonadota bacterium]
MVTKSFPTNTASVKPKRALLSVSDKTGLVELAKALADHGIELVSTGGTHKAIKDAGIPVKDVSEITGFPEVMDGRVKTLHPSVHGGLLARRDDAAHTKAMKDHNIGAIDIVVINLYPFAETVAKGGDFALCVENIDIGGPAMIRAAAKNHDFVTVITNASDYDTIVEELNKTKGEISYETRRMMAAKAYATTAAYDGAISSWFGSQLGADMPPVIVTAGTLAQPMRYGENPHQKAAFYADGTKRAGVALATQHQGKELSYNNLNDTDAAFELVSEFEEPTVAIIKHANPCGVASHASLYDAYRHALRCDPVSAFGGIVAMNRRLDAATAEEMVKVFTEVIIAPEVDEEAKAIIAAKKNLRLLTTGGMADPAQKRLSIKTIAGGYLVQDADAGRITKADLKVVTKRSPTAKEMEDMLFAFRVAKHVKSNAIVYVKDGTTVGIGAGQMSRIDSSRIAAWKSAEAAKTEKLDQPMTIGSVVASDAFFPFADGLLAAAEAGATAIIQPGGSVRDDEVIAAADEKGLAMVFTGMRHFRH